MEIVRRYPDLKQNKEFIVFSQKIQYTRDEHLV